jgi:hypothetical protein
MSVLILALALAGQTVSAPEESRVKGSSAERTIAEFLDICVRPRFDDSATQRAVARSDFAYQPLPQSPPSTTSFRWRASRAVLALELGPAVEQITAQCALSVGSIQPRSGGQIAAMMKPALEAELGLPVAIKMANDKVELGWAEKGAPFRYRVTLVGSATQPHQAQWYALDRLSNGGR